MAHVITKPAILLAMGVLAACAAAADEDLALKVTANRGQIYLGESFILEVTISGSSQPVAPDLSRLVNCRIKALGSRDISNYSITIINGRITKEGFTGRVVSYEITPTAAGTLQAGPVSVAVEGRALTEPGPAVRVTDIEKQDLVLISVAASRETVLVDEPFDIALRVLIRRLPPGRFADVEPLFPGNPPDLSAPYLAGEGLDGLVGPDIRQLLQARLVTGDNQPGLAINNITLAPSPFDFNSLLHGISGESRKARFALDRRSTEQNGRAYHEYSLTLTFTPREEGNYVFGPVVFKGAVPVEVNDQGQARGTPVFAVGPAGTVRVVPPPEEGRPPGFTGALGTNLTAAAELDAATGNIGDPLKLTLSLAGQVRFDKMLPPKLNLQTNIVRHFTVYDNTVQTVKQDQQRRQYLYTLRPTHAGAFELPPIEIAYYDTQARQYKTVATAPIPLVIRRGTEVTARHLQGHTNRPPERKSEAVVAAETPAPCRTAPEGAHPASLLGDRPWLPAAGAAGPTLYLLTLAGGLIRRRRGHWKLAARRRRALASARRRLQAARRDPSLAGRRVCAAITSYLADRLGAPPAGLTPGDARRRLEQAGISAPVSAALAAIFERHFNAGFSKQVPAGGAAEDIRQAGELLENIDRQTRNWKALATEGSGERQT